jgi:hypothetical protein
LPIFVDFTANFGVSKAQYMLNHHNISSFKWENEVLFKLYADFSSLRDYLVSGLLSYKLKLLETQTDSIRHHRSLAGHRFPLCISDLSLAVFTNHNALNIDRKWLRPLNGAEDAI